MRTVLISLSALLMSNAAFAMPAVGDDSVFDAKLTQGNNSETATLEVKLVSYNQNTNTFDERQTITQAGQQPQTSDSNIDAASLPTDLQMADILKNCGSQGGTIKSTTVPAGKFQTCDVPFKNSDGSAGTASLADVPFGVVKQVTNEPNGVVVTLELHTYTMGH